MGPQPIGFVEATLSADSTAWELGLLGPPMLCYGGTSLVTGLELRAIETNLQARVQWRTADVDPAEPDAWDGTPGTTRSSNGNFAESFTPTTGKLWVQAAVFVSLSTGSTKKTGVVRLWTSVLGAGWIVGRQRLVVQQGASGLVVPVGPPVAAAGVSGLMMGVTYTGVEGTISSPTPNYRTFDVGNTTWPGGWTAGSAGSNVTSDQKVNQIVATTTTDKTLVQAGFEYSATSTTNGVIDVIVAAKQ